MPLQNRVTPWSEIVSHPGRGELMGNRGRLHSADRRLVRPRGWTTKAWISCELKHKDWHREVMQPGKYTELFFLDEAVALAAGHRPCALCRHTSFRDFMSASGFLRAGDLDQELHEQRLALHWRQERRDVQCSQVPDGAMIQSDAAVGLVWEGGFWPYGVEGYGDPLPLSGGGTLLTPDVVIRAFTNGYVPRVHPSILRRTP